MTKRTQPLITRRAALAGAGAMAIAGTANAGGVSWGWIGEKVAEGCLTAIGGSGAAVIARVLSGLSGQSAVQLHEESLRQIADMMKEEFHMERVLEVNTSILTLFRSMADYDNARRSDRLEKATDRVDELVFAAEKCLYGPRGGSYWFAGLESFGTAVSLKQAILLERATAFKMPGEYCNIQDLLAYSDTVIGDWIKRRNALLRKLVTDPVLAVVGGTEVGDILDRVTTMRGRVWSTSIEGDTINLDVKCGWLGTDCTEAEERARANRLVKGYRDRIDAARFKKSERRVATMRKHWSWLPKCGDTIAQVPSTVPATPRPPRATPPAPRPALQRSTPTSPAIVPATAVVPSPVYPRRALQAEKTGDVTCRYSIDVDGSVQDIEVVHAEPSGWGFEKAAIDALRMARCTPRMVNGMPAKSRHRIEFAFVLKDG